MRYRSAALRLGVLGVVAGASVVGFAGGVAGASGNGPAAHGVVTAINGDSAGGTCGASGASGALTVVSNSTTSTVDVTSATTFVAKHQSAPTFGDLCVGDSVVAVGAASNGTLVATGIAFRVPTPTTVHVTGTVTSVNGDPTDGTCGTAGATGTFTVGTTTLNVDGSTTFKEPTVHEATFANVCVGDSAVVMGTASGDAVAATSVALKPPPAPNPIHVTGTVASVNGVSTSGTCGTAGSSGSFDVSVTRPTGTSTTTVNVTTATSFEVKKVTGATFANVCVGDKTVSVGTTTAGSFTAVAVAAVAPKS